ncbi:hypothetical protein HN51_027230 [Arachis hypogaea]
MNRIRFLKFYFARGKSSCGEYLSEGLTQFRKELRCHGNVEELWQGKRILTI